MTRIRFLLATATAAATLAPAAAAATDDYVPFVTDFPRQSERYVPFVTDFPQSSPTPASAPEAGVDWSGLPLEGVAATLAALLLGGALVRFRRQPRLRGC